LFRVHPLFHAHLIDARDRETQEELYPTVDGLKGTVKGDISLQLSAFNRGWIGNEIEMRAAVPRKFVPALAAQGLPLGNPFAATDRARVDLLFLSDEAGVQLVELAASLLPQQFSVK
jgi:hypothetical protein